MRTCLSPEHWPGIKLMTALNTVIFSLSRRPWHTFLLSNTNIDFSSRSCALMSALSPFAHQFLFLASIQPSSGYPEMLHGFKLINKTKYTKHLLTTRTPRHQFSCRKITSMQADFEQIVNIPIFWSVWRKKQQNFEHISGWNEMTQLLKVCIWRLDACAHCIGPKHALTMNLSCSHREAPCKRGCWFVQQH